jgi:hypothetical protein
VLRQILVHAVAGLQPGTAMWSFVTSDPASAGVGDPALPQVALELALDALQGVVDRLHVALQALGDLLVALALDVEPQDLGLEVGQDLVEVRLQGADALGGDDQVGRVADGDRRQDVGRGCARRRRRRDGALEGDVVVERAVLLAGRRLDRVMICGSRRARRSAEGGLQSPG